ncbi:MAG: hypothetical protein COT73_07175 [Bdellovibrio sp. CG10_big_fil_rev_8_21_14_0_10_47_8]|nr:MAG: hypothetical protein COT73_07175 [Bdellovibrio sp. CG10_big_fil_rev_8_21_14_0_10_47_8]
MKSLSFHQLKSLSIWLQERLLGAQLQDVWTNGQVIVFEFYRQQDLFLCVDMMPNTPMMVLLDQKPPVEKKPKPLTIFLKSHAANLRWAELTVEENKGRILFLELESGPRNCQIEFQLIPRAANVLVRAGGKQISWNKPRDLPPSQIMPVEEGDDAEIFDGKTVADEWRKFRFQKVQSENAPKNKEDPRPRALQKKLKALEQIRTQLQEDPASRWQELGEFLKGPTPVTVEFHDLYDGKRSRSWNLENAFRQAKAIKKKREGTLLRVEKLQQEISDLQADIELHSTPQTMAPTSSASKLMKKTGSKGRKLDLGDGFEAVLGKSARDNLAILRQARAWDLWMHLRDYPGAHAIILRPKNREVPRSFIEDVARWLLAESFSGKKQALGDRYEVVVAECRYVRPIKGDRLGRVTYHHPQVYSFAANS